MGASYRWQGVATTPGTYDLTVRLCYLNSLPGLPADAEVCEGTARVRIVVEGPGGGSTPVPPTGTAAAATPVAAAARFTG